MAFSIACKGGKPPGGDMPPDNPLLTTGHGQFVAADGQLVEPDRELIMAAQRHYIARLRMQVPDEEAARVSDLIYDLLPATDAILANALFIDWLLERARPEDRAQIDAMNDALRRHYVVNIQDNPILPEDGRWSKGIPHETARRLEARGVEVFVTTGAASAAYRAECRENGVPVPPPMFSSAWEYRGALATDFLSDDSSTAELWTYASQSPRGVCLALPRYAVDASGEVGDQTEVLGIICLGTETSKACYFDNPLGQSFERNEPVAIDEFLGGADLVDNGQGMCTDCHAGENPFVVHPNDPAFAGLSPALQPLAWHDPLVSSTWLQNPGPTNLLDAVSSVGQCNSCHSAGLAGRFPEVSSALPGYCWVLGTATGTSDEATMPPPGTDRALFLPHIRALARACDAPPSSPGTVVEVDIPDDEGFLSPPMILDPLYQCATKVAVRGAILDAELSLYVNGALVDTSTARNPDQEVFEIPALVAGDVVTARQELGGVQSELSAGVTARDHTLDFPDGLPAPSIDPALIYDCAEALSVRHVPGAEITVYFNGGYPQTSTGSTGWTLVYPGKHPIERGDRITARQALCADLSDASPEVTAVAAPTTIPAPSFDPPTAYAGQELVTIETLINGARTTVGVAGVGAVGEFATSIPYMPNYDIASELGRPLESGDRLTASQTLCSQGPTQTTDRVLRCENLPAPRIRHPLVGEGFVVVTEAVPGARLRIYDAAGDELGDGSGMIITLNRVLTGTDTITVVQGLGDCTSSEGFRISARNPAAD